jgi:hypothetical protein
MRVEGVVKFNVNIFICSLAVFFLFSIILPGTSNNAFAKQKSVGAFGIKVNADNLLKKMQSEGKHSFIKVKVIKGKKLYVVIVDDADKVKKSAPVKEQKSAAPAVGVSQDVTPKPHKRDIVPIVLKKSSVLKLVEISNEAGSRLLVVDEDIKVSAYQMVDSKKKFTLLGTYATNGPAQWLSDYKSKSWYRVELSSGGYAYIRKQQVISIKEVDVPVDEVPQAVVAPVVPAKEKVVPDVYFSAKDTSSAVLGVGFSLDALNLSGGPLLSYKASDKIALQVHYGIGTYTTYGFRGLYYFDLIDYATSYAGVGYIHSKIEADVSGTIFTQEASGGAAYFGMEKSILDSINIYVEGSVSSLQFEDMVETVSGKTYRVIVDHSPVSIGVGVHYYF